MHRRITKRSAIGIGVCLAVVVGALWVVRHGDDGSRASGPARGSDSGPFTLQLSAGRASSAPQEPAPFVVGDELKANEITAITDRLPTFKGEDGDQVDFQRPPQSLPRPRVGETIETLFGGTGDAPRPAVGSGPLKVLRHQPDGDVETAPFLSVTFNHPMVPLGTLEQLDEADVPVAVTPELDGHWRWIGTRTLRFEHDDPDIDRLPAATTYTVEIPAGTTSTTGSTMAEAVTWTFSTPPPRVESLTPDADVIDRDAIFVATFDQRVSPKAVLDTIELTAGSRRSLRLATEAEIAADDAARKRIETALDGRWIAFTTTSDLPLDTAVEIAIGPGTPSAEGSAVTEVVSRHRTRTYAPLRVRSQECGYAGSCHPGDELAIIFNNPLDLESFDSDLIEVSPAIGASIGVYEDRLSIQGSTDANTTYTVRLPASLKDTFGQTLGKGQTRTFEVGDATPRLTPFPKPLITTDPFADTPAVSVTSSGHETLSVTLHSVSPADYPAYLDFLDDFWDGGKIDGLPGRRVSSTTVDVAGDPGQISETSINLANALSGKPGHLLVYVASTREFPADSEEHWENRPTVAWVQATSIGVDALSDADHLLAWATDLRDGSPLEGVGIRLEGSDASVSTNGDGLADVPLTQARYLVAERNGETALLVADYGWLPLPVSDVARWFVMDDRQLYRPGETAHLKGWVRRLTLSKDARIAPVGGAPTIQYLVNDSFGNELAAGTVSLSRSGGFDLEIQLPPGANLGPAFVQLELVGGDAIGETTVRHMVQIEEFRRPEFEVITRAESAEPHLLTQPLTVAAVAQYFAGGTLPDAPVTWRVTNQPTRYSPPHWSDFSFGVWRPPWLEDVGFNDFGNQSFGRVDFAEDSCCGDPTQDPDVEHLTYDGQTDAQGRHFLQLDFRGQKPDEPITVSANASVTDVNRQAFGSTVDLLVHPASLYVGLASDRTFVRRGESMGIDAIATDIDGKAVSGRKISITSARVTQKLLKGAWTDVDVDPEECIVTSGDEPVSCSFTPSIGGQYRITSVITDDDGGRNRSELTVWVSGADAPPSRSVEQEAVTIVPDQEEYEPGDIAELLVISPFHPAKGRLTIQRNGIEQTRMFDLTETSTILEIPITEELVPGIAIQVDLVGSAPRRHNDGTLAPDLPARPAFAAGSLLLAVPAVTKTLAVTATPSDDEVEPGGSTTVDVTVVDASGDPVEGAEVAVVVVDEAVLSLVGYELPDPIAAIYQPLVNGIRADYARATLLLADPESLGGESDESKSVSTTLESFAATGLAIGDAEGGATLNQGAFAARSLSAQTTGKTPIDVRTNFDALAVFEPAVPTGTDGTVAVDVTLPDNLTRYRVMVVAADAVDQFGSAESTITARIPLQVRPSPPRFVNFGDEFELPVVIQNQSDDDLDVDVVVEVANLSLTGPAGQRVTVPAHERVEVRFPAAAEDAGIVRYRVSALSGDLADSASGSLPAYTPTTTEAFATYGVIDDGAIVQPLLTPTGIVPTFGGLEVDTSSTALQALTDSVIYLTDYPYASADAYASRIIALTSLKDVFAAFATATAPSPAELNATVQADIEALSALQNDIGGFSTWQRGAPTQPYESVQATHALIVAEAAGYRVNEETLRAAKDFIANIEAHFPSEWDAAARHAVSAYAIHVRARAGERDPAKAEALYRSDDDLALDALAWLWPVIDDPTIDAAIERTFANRVAETPGAASFTTDFEESASALVLASDRRTDGIVLDALLTKRQDSDLIPKLVTGLIGNQVRGRWNNVQENGFILLAMKRYFDTFEATTPAFIARGWLGNTYATEHSHQGRSVDVAHTLVPLSELAGNPDIVLSKDGSGRLYYRLGLRYAPADLLLAPRDEGFVVDRSYEATGDPDDVTRDSDGTWHIKPGATVRVRLTLVADSQRTNMALVDPLPAGLEAVNPALAASPRTPPEEPQEDRDPIALSWFRSTWFDHQNLRDDRVEAYSAYLPAGTYEYSYVVRATTLGTFVTPPAKAEEIYAPEVFGRTSTDVVVVG